jgi:transcriptional regulator with XRE-family HTH domain
MDGRRADREVAARIGRNVWFARRRAGYSQEGLGALCSLHRTEIGMIENGQRLPRADTLIKLAGALGARPERLLEGIEWIAPGPSAEGSFAVRGEG